MMHKLLFYFLYISLAIVSVNARNAYSTDVPEKRPETKKSPADLCRENANVEMVIDQVIKAVRQKDAAILEQYVSKGALLSWGPCNAMDQVEIHKMTFQEMRERLQAMAHGDEIYVHTNPDIEKDIFEKNAKAVTIYTDGWMSEYPYLNLFFVYREDNAIWEWRGACDSDGPPFKLLKDGRYHEVYYREPVLPRQGPRTFKNYSSLKARIKEIIHFKKYDALIPYVESKRSLIFGPKQSLILGECSSEMTKKDMPIGKSTPIEEIIAFLRQNGAKAKDIKFS
ncbi:MAG: hypothetical protein HGB21_08540, partial [Nitrospirae bacterium]|nr:hypothetical protein [Nitrospirota bacterium]